MFNSAFGRFTNVRTDYYPPALRSEIDRINQLVFENINNGVYRPASPPPRRPTRRHSMRCLQRSTSSKHGLLSSAISSGRRSPRPTGDCSRPHSPRRRPSWSLPGASAAYQRLFQSLQLPARPLPAARHRRDGEHRADQAALLRSAPGQSVRDRAARAAARLFGIPRSGTFFVDCYFRPTRSITADMPTWAEPSRISASYSTTSMLSKAANSCSSSARA